MCLFFVFFFFVFFFFCQYHNSFDNCCFVVYSEVKECELLILVFLKIIFTIWVNVFLYFQQFDLEGLPCLETTEIRTQNLSNIIKKHKAHTDTYLNPNRQTSAGFRAMEEGLISRGGRNLRLPLHF